MPELWTGTPRRGLSCLWGYCRLTDLRATPTAKLIGAGILPSTRTATIGDRTARFRCESVAEVRRVDTAVNERDVLERFISASKDGTVWDVGAAVGTFSIPAALHGAEVVAFEPHAPNADRLTENADLNDVEVDLRRHALGAEAGETGFTPVGPVGSGKHHVDESGAESVRIKRGDEVTPFPDAVKIDVEGAELDVIRGARDALEHAHTMLVEVHPGRGVDESEVREELAGLGFDVDELEIGREQVHLWASR